MWAGMLLAELLYLRVLVEENVSASSRPPCSLLFQRQSTDRLAKWEEHRFTLREVEVYAPAVQTLKVLVIARKGLRI